MSLKLRTNACGKWPRKPKRRRRTEKDVEYLTMSHRLADNPDTIIETRRHISRLIRNIDRCLEMLENN